MHDTYSWICPLFVSLLYPASIVWTFETKTGLLNLDIGSLHSRFSSLLAAGDVSSSLAAKSEEKRLLFAKISLIQTVCTFIFKIIVNRVIISGRVKDVIFANNSTNARIKELLLSSCIV